MHNKAGKSALRNHLPLNLVGFDGNEYTRCTFYFPLIYTHFFLFALKSST